MCGEHVVVVDQQHEICPRTASGRTEGVANRVHKLDSVVSVSVGGVGDEKIAEELRFSF